MIVSTSYTFSRPSSCAQYLISGPISSAKSVASAWSRLVAARSASWSNRSRATLSCTSASSKSSRYRRNRLFIMSAYTVACMRCSAGSLPAAYSVWQCERSCVDQCMALLNRPVTLCRSVPAWASFAGRVDCAIRSCAYAHARSASNSSSWRLSIFAYNLRCISNMIFWGRQLTSIFDHLHCQGRRFLKPPALCLVGAVFPVSREIVVSKAIGAALLVCELDSRLDD